MRKTVIYVAGWVVAGGAAVALSTVAVSQVGDRVTGKRPGALSVGEVRAELADNTGGTSTTVAEGSASTTTLLGGPGGSGGSVDSRPTTPTSNPSTNPATTPATGSSSSSTSSIPATTSGSSSTTVPSPPPSVRTYSLVGGTATLRFAATGVTVQEATPRPGYSVVVEPTHDNGVRVEFRSDDRRSRVTGWWENGPRDDVDED